MFQTQKQKHWQCLCTNFLHDQWSWQTLKIIQMVERVHGYQGPSIEAQYDLYNSWLLQTLKRQNYQPFI